MNNQGSPHARNQAALTVVRPRTAGLASRMNEKLSDRITAELSPRATASSSNQATDSVARALLSDEAGQAWLANLLQEQRQASERQITRQHEMLRDHFGATLRPITQALAGGRPLGTGQSGPTGRLLGGHPEDFWDPVHPSKGRRKRDSWDPDNWEPEDFDDARWSFASDSIPRDHSTTASLHGNGLGTDSINLNDMRVAAPKVAATPKALTGDPGQSPSNGSKATDPKAGQKSSGTGDASAPRTSSGSASSDTKAPQERLRMQQPKSSDQSATTMEETSSPSLPLGEPKSKSQVDEVDLKNTRLPTWMVRSETLDPEHEQTSTVEWLMGFPLDLASVFLIIANTVFMMVDSMHVGYRIRVLLGLEVDGSWQGADDVFKVSELVFTTLFLIELILRLWWHGMKLLKDPLNLVDALVVAITTLDSFVFSQFDFKAGISAIRLIRMVKVGKTFRFAKALKMIEPLRILLKTITASVSSLVWSMCILFLFMVVAAIIATQMLQGYIQDDANDMKMRLWCEHHYGNVMKALWTMFMITMSGGWPAWVSPLVHEVSLGYAFLFGTYVTLVVFAVIRVITALFLKETLAQAAKDADQLFKERINKKSATMAKLTDIFHLADINQDNVLCEQEFNKSLHDPTIVKLFYELEMEPAELEGIFYLLDDGNLEVELDEFLSGIMKMKGLSRATDLLILQHDNRKMLNAVQALEDQTLNAVAEMQKEFKSLLKLEADIEKEVHNIEHDMHDMHEAHLHDASLHDVSGAQR